MNATCSPRTAAPATSGVTESLRKPRYFVKGSPDAYEVRVEMPGVTKDAVKIDLDDNVLTLRGDRAASVPQGYKTLHRELSPLNYLLRLRLNTPVDEEKMSAKFEDGVLVVSLPIKEAAKPRQIPVN